MSASPYSSTETYWTPPASLPSSTALRSQIGRRWVWMSILSVLVFFATYMGLVRTHLGQYMENAALLGAQQATQAEVADALDNLDVISVTSLCVVMVALVILGVMRRSWRIAAAGMFTLGASAVLAEVLKRFVLPRPDLADIYQNNAHNSFPSGHTTIAMAILVSLLLVVSYRWRGLVMLLALGWATSIGAAAVTARWHRLSDTIGGDMIAIGVGALVAMWLLGHHAIEERETKAYPLRVVYVVFLVIVGVGSVAVGLLLGIGTMVNFGVLQEVATSYSTGVPAQLTAHLDPVFNENIYLSAQSLALGLSTISALWFWATFYRLGTTAP